MMMRPLAIAVIGGALGLGLYGPALADINAEWKAFDVNNDGIITREEFAAALFDKWDEDGNARISRQEFGDHDLFGQVEFGTYDVTDDGMWDYNEYSMAFEQSNVFQRYSNGGSGLRQEEFATFYDDAGDAGLLDV